MIESTRFGALEVDDEAVLELPDGLIGLPGTDYALMATTMVLPFHRLQSVSHPDLALPVTNPWLFFSDYEVQGYAVSHPLLTREAARAIESSPSAEAT